MGKLVKWLGITKDEVLFGWLMFLSIMVIGLVIQNVMQENDMAELARQVLRLSVLLVR